MRHRRRCNRCLFVNWVPSAAGRKRKAAHQAPVWRSPGCGTVLCLPDVLPRVLVQLCAIGCQLTLAWLQMAQPPYGGPGHLASEDAELMTAVATRIISGKPLTERKSTFQVGARIWSQQTVLPGALLPCCRSSSAFACYASCITVLISAVIPPANKHASHARCPFACIPHHKQAHVALVSSVAEVRAVMSVLLQSNKIRHATHNIMAYRIQVGA